jgi:hypothetical protein
MIKEAAAFPKGLRQAVVSCRCWQIFKWSLSLFSHFQHPTV